jgi:gliding motility-associated-like protein
MRFLILFILLFISFAAFSQDLNQGLVCYYPFDGYPIVDKSGNGNKAFIGSDSTLGCGVEGNAMRFDGLRSDMFIVGPASFDNFKTGPFSISFYFKASNQVGNSTLDIISKRKNCTTDSSFAIRYTPSNNQMSVEVSENDKIRNVIIQRLDFGRCWQHIVVIRDYNKLSLYVNGRLAQVNLATRRVNITSDAPLSIAKSPCLQTTDRKFAGYLDELRIYDRPLSETEVGLLYAAPDQIANRDTIMFLHSSIKMRVNRTCATDFTWSPKEDLTSFRTDTTTITPKTGGIFKYVLTMKEAQCTSLDTIQVKVIDPATLDCGRIYLPNAFTPNGDGLNNEFFISNPFAIEQLDIFEIFDSWGSKMFSTTNKFDHWDGTFNGKPLNPGVYVWKARFRCRNQALSDFGSITILK